MRKSSRVLAGMGVVAACALVLQLGLGGLAQAQSTSADKNLYPFGGPSGGAAVKVPSPPQEPTLAPTITTKTTTRIYGANPYEEAVSVTQHLWPAARPETPRRERQRPRPAVGADPADPGRPADRDHGHTADPLPQRRAGPVRHQERDSPGDHE